ncbi:hypothetical protein ACLOJK_036532 [Asimina triloba]
MPATCWHLCASLRLKEMDLNGVAHHVILLLVGPSCASLPAIEAVVIGTVMCYCRRGRGTAAVGPGRPIKEEEEDTVGLGVCSVVAVAGSEGDIIERMMPDDFLAIRHGGLSTPVIADGEDKDLTAAVPVVASQRWWRQAAVLTDLASQPRCRPVGRLRLAIESITDGRFGWQRHWGGWPLIKR